MKAWLVRAGSKGEQEGAALDGGRAVIGFDELPDLSGVSDRDALKAIYGGRWPDASPGRVNNVVGQVWTFRSRISPGDVVVLPLKSTPQIAVGRVAGGYEYRADALEGTLHSIPVDWARTDVPRTAIQQDLLYSLGAFMTVCEIRRNDAAWRLERVLETGVDPGPRDQEQPPDTEDDPTGSDGDQAVLDIPRIAADRIQGFIGERFREHALERLVEAVLEAEGFVTQGVEPGPDGGIDIYAGKGPLGLDSPRLIVQVKSSPTPVDVKVVRELHGVLSTHGADQALLVAWGGVNRAAKAELRGQFFRVRVWDADQLIEAVTRNYDQLREGIKAELPLGRVWTLIEPDDGTAPSAD